MTKEEVKKLVVENYPDENPENLDWEEIGNGSEILTDKDHEFDIGITVTDTEILFHEAEPNYCKFSLEDKNKDAILGEIVGFKYGYGEFSSTILDVSVCGEKEELQDLVKLIIKECQDRNLKLFNCRTTDFSDEEGPDNESYI